MTDRFGFAEDEGDEGVTEEHDDYALRWPRQLFKNETTRLLNDRARITAWSERCSLLLEDAFVNLTPRDDFNSADLGGHDPSSTGLSPAGLGAGQQFMVALLRRADSLREVGMRAPYYSQRRAGVSGNLLTLRTAVHEFGRLISDLEGRGYLEKAFGKDCVDDPTDIDPSEVIASELGVQGLWPLPLQRMGVDQDLFLDIVEVFHDLVAAPRSRTVHPYAGCGYHHGDFSAGLGRAVYRWSVNRILSRTAFGLRLAEEGEDRGRLVAVTDDVRTELAHRMAERSDDSTGDVVRHALALFRGRDAGEHERRSACIALAGVLEERRGLLKDRLFKKDEGALFRLANDFGIRHQNA